jgi:hypothetical protein
MSNAIEYIDKILNESIEEKKYTKDEFINELDKTIKDIFPKSYVRVSNKAAFGNDSINITLLLGKDKSEFENGISHNDPLQETIWIHECIDDNENIKDIITAENPYGGRLHLNDYSSKVKTGWRNKTTSPQKMIDYLKKYFENVKKIVIENKANLNKLVKDKY